MNIDPAVLYKLVVAIGLMSAVLAAGISALFQVLNGWRERLAADKRHLRDLALKAAIVQWEHEVATFNEKNRSLRFGEEPAKIGEAHFDMILIKKLKMLEMFRKGHVTSENIDKGIREMRATATSITNTFRAIQIEERERRTDSNKAD